MSDSAESVVRKFLAAWKRPDLDELVSFFGDDAVVIDPRGTHNGIEAIKTELHSVLKVYSSFTVEVETLVANGRTVMTERVDRFEVRGKPFGLEVAAVFELDSDSRITRWRDYYDRRSLEDRIAAALAPPS